MPPRKGNLQGQRFGRWTVQEGFEPIPAGTQLQLHWYCICDCGTPGFIPQGRLFLRQGCRKCAVRPPIHGQGGHGKKRTRLYRTWAAMRERCENPNNPAYKNYGGRGVVVHAEWQKFAKFAEWIAVNLGACPAGHSLDRIDPFGNYVPGNLRWADATTQARNQRGHIAREIIERRELLSEDDYGVLGGF